MVGTKYLSDLVDKAHFRKGCLNLIKAPTGCGKTYFALQHIPSLVKNPKYKVLFLIDTTNGKEQIIKKYNAEAPSFDWTEAVKANMIEFGSNNPIIVMTYAKFGILYEKDSSFLDKLQYIICDEIHNLLYFRNIPPHPNNCDKAKNGIEDAIHNAKTIVIGLTATPNKVHTWMNCEINRIEVDDTQLLQYDTKQTIPYNSIEEAFQKISKEEIGLCYARQIRSMEAIKEKAISVGLTPLCIWSINNTNHRMTEEQLAARQVLLEQSTIPKPYNLLIINSSSETSIKINSAVDYVIVDCKNEDTQIQVRGRVNHDIEKMFLPSDIVNALYIGEEYIGRRLFDADKERLCEELHIYKKNKKGIYKWTGIKKLLLQFGYTVEEGRCNNKRFAVIEKEDE